MNHYDSEKVAKLKIYIVKNALKRRHAAQMKAAGLKYVRGQWEGDEVCILRLGIQTLNAHGLFPIIKNGASNV